MAVYLQGNIVGMSQAAIAQLSEQYAAQHATMAGGQEGTVSGAAAHKRAVASLQKQVCVPGCLSVS